MFGGGQLNNFQPDAVLFSVGGWLLTGVALIYEGDFHRFAGHGLDLLNPSGDLGPVLLIGWGDQHGQQLA